MRHARVRGEARGEVEEAGIGFDELGDGALVERAFPYLSVPSAHVAIADRVGGFVDPKKMIEAQNALTLRANPEENRILLANATEILERGGGGARRRRRARRRHRGGDERLGGRRRRRGGRVHPPARREIGPRGDRASFERRDERRNLGRENRERRLPRGGLGRGLRSRVAENRRARGGDSRRRRRALLKDMPTLKYQFKPRETTVDGSDGSNSHSRNEATSVYVLPPIRYPGPIRPRGGT